jgi:hypothetical protein
VINQCELLKLYKFQIMKRILINFIISFVILTFYSCNKEQSNEEFADTVINLQSRSTNWCDGGGNNPPAVYVYDAYVDPLNPELCCVSFRFLSEYLNRDVQLTTTDFNFGNQTGNPGNNQSYFFNVGDGSVTFCFAQQGSHFLIQILDGNELPITCNDFPNQCP